MASKLLTAFLMIVSALLGFSTGEVTDDKVQSPLEHGDCPVAAEKECPQEAAQCPIKVIAYTDSGKYFCEGIGPGAQCKSTEEILSELG